MRKGAAHDDEDPQAQALPIGNFGHAPIEGRGQGSRVLCIRTGWEDKQPSDQGTRFRGSSTKAIKP
jgi:hypothetical protein